MYNNSGFRRWTGSHYFAVRLYHAPGACNDGLRSRIREVEVLRTYTWDEYYDKFYDWAESTQVRNLYGLTSLGPVYEADVKSLLNSSVDEDDNESV